MSELDQWGDHIPAEFALVGRDIWSEPLTQSERQMIENVLREGDLRATRIWLNHCVRIFDAQASAGK